MLNTVNGGNTPLSIPRYHTKGNRVDLTPFLGKPSFGREFTDHEADVLYQYFLGLRTLHAWREVNKKPKTLFIEPHNGCQIRCTYCYAETLHQHGHYVDPEQIRDLVEKYEFTQILIFGGDFFYDWPKAKQILDIIKGVKTLSISTNAVSLTTKRLEYLRSCCEKLEIQISLEPTHWGFRIVDQKSQKHQNELLGNLPGLVDAGLDLAYHIVIPSRGLKEWRSMESYRDELNFLSGTERWIAGWQMQDGIGDIPPWTKEWIQEEWDAIDEPSYNMHRMYQGLASITVSHLNAIQQSLDILMPAYYFNCNAGMGSIAIGPDNNLYSCHEEAVGMNEKFKLEDATPRMLWRNILPKFSKSMNNDVCRTCPAHFTCGGICFAHRQDVKCEFERQKLGLGFKAYGKVMPSFLTVLADRQRQFADIFLKDFSSFEKDVRSEKWQKLVSGELDLQEVAELAGRSLNIFSQPDTKLWELEEDSRATGAAYRPVGS